jgi:hypothetical protein
MIHVNLKPEPAEFDEKVRRPGRRFLTQVPNPTRNQWNHHRYWALCLPKLHEAYGGICSYCCHWISDDTGWKNVEHFKPKSRFPNLAYEWNNYRLVCGVLNNRKGIKAILDPFKIEDGWFIIDFATFRVKPSPTLTPALRRQVQSTCDVLGLNNDSTCMKSRMRYIEGYCKDKWPFSHLEEEAPFIAKELRRQGLVDAIKDMIRY